jgi:hypothetical protein
VAILDQLIERHGAGVVRLGGLPNAGDASRKPRSPRLS